MIGGLIKRAVESARVRTLLCPLTLQARLTRKVIARKKARQDLGRPYQDEPTVALILLSFNHRRNIKPILTRLRETAVDELIVCEDGSLDGSDREWRRFLIEPNDFLLISNDIHEIRAYNRAISFSRSEFVGILQDDDIPPADPSWVKNVVALFQRHPKLAVLGCWHGWALDFDAPANVVHALHQFGHPFKPNKPVPEMPYFDAGLNLPFMFVEGLGIGPIFFRRQVFEEIGGFDLSFSEPGAPGIMLDYDICMRAWISGWQVGLYKAPPFERAVGGQGTMMFAKAKRKANSVKNTLAIRRVYAAHIHSIRQAVDEANRGLAARESVSLISPEGAT